MNDSEKDKLIKRDMGSIENVVRHAFNQGYNMGYTDGKETIKALEKESKTGHWIETWLSFWCSECKTQFGGAYKFCPNCGAKMESEEQT